jgi:hypothetical protein
MTAFENGSCAFGWRIWALSGRPKLAGSGMATFEGVSAKADAALRDFRKAHDLRVSFPERAPELAFTNGRHDDQADSMSQFLNWVHEYL